MSGISWLVYHYADSGEIYQVTGVPGIFPSDGAQVDLEGNEIVRYLMKDDLESLIFSLICLVETNLAWLDHRKELEL